MYRHAVAVVCIAVLWCVLSAARQLLAHICHCKGLRPTTLLHQKGRGDPRETHKGCKHICCQASSPGFHAKPIIQQSTICKIKAFIAVPILQEKTGVFFNSALDIYYA